MNESIVIEPRKRDPYRYSYHRLLLSERHVNEHVLTIARKHDGDRVHFGWSLCIPSRWETTQGKNKREVWYDTAENRHLTKDEYDVLVKLAADPPVVVDPFELDGPLLDTSEAEDKVRTEAINRLDNIVYHKETQRFVCDILVKGDMFCRKTGRDKAIERLETEPITVALKEVYAIESILDFLRQCPDVPSQVSEIAEVHYQITKFNREFDRESNESEEKPPVNETLLQRISNLWKSDLGKASLVLGAVCFGYLLSLFVCAIL